TDPKKSAVVAAFQFGNPPLYQWQILARAGNANMMDVVLAEVGSGPPDAGGGYKAAVGSNALTVGAWARITIAVGIGDAADAAGGGTVADVCVDGTPAIHLPLALPVRNAEPRLVLGTFFVDTPSAAWMYFLDDVTVDLTAP